MSWMRQPVGYRDAADRFAEGTPAGLAAWLVLCCRAMEAGRRRLWRSQTRCRVASR
ncbi:hypothetical protein I551_6795 [Mycobacterium ulcerans str. Harvey]|uniref:Uncharacterized protein n=1 Tax=Mycobacterium ulcerans str. Harvey TaxID=1299332 RepID=A0ABN0QPY4_MYCUL|nr:hypothetical protein I551_6795 [Mycobacterium ulcerans str. Harvey]